MLRTLQYKTRGTELLVGSDAVGEVDLQGATTEKLEPVPGLRFALAVIAARAMTIESKIRAGEPMCIGTSYPQTALRVLGDVGVNAFVTERSLAKGGVEALPWQPELGVDAIVDLVQTGESLRQNGLVIIRDELETVDLLKVTKN